VRRGERMVLTYRGKPVVRLEPVCDEPGQPNDPFYALDALADAKGRSLTNRQMDDVVYGS
jgi:antitoxin (DNA-binding transcriptional repressor) of toxin-antitoxin stability system